MIEWLKREGTMSPDFLHLEDIKGGSIDFKAIRTSLGNIVRDEEDPQCSKKHKI